jgi:hypothetical protein
MTFRVNDAEGKGLSDIDRERKSAAWKVWIASELEHNTSAPSTWIASQLNMGSPQMVERYVNRFSLLKNTDANYDKFTSKYTE